MKRILLIAGDALAVMSCATISGPQTAGDTLVIGSFVLDFPGGFFNRPPQSFDDGIKLALQNRTTGKRMELRTTRDGYFWFVAAPNESSEFLSYFYEDRQQSDVAIQFRLHSHPLSRTRDRPYTVPERQRAEAAQGIVNWSYRRSLGWQDRRAEMIQFLRRMQPDSPWLSYRVELK